MGYRRLGYGKESDEMENGEWRICNPRLKIDCVKGVDEGSGLIFCGKETG